MSTDGLPLSQPLPLPYTFAYVKIPADADAPFEELAATAKAYGNSLESVLTPVFAGGSVTNADSLRAEFGDAVDQKMAQLNMVAAEGSVEVFALVRPAKSTLPIAHTGTYLYFDEKMGVLKDRPVNHRARHIASACGLEVESPFHGDVYVGRVCIEPTPMHCVDFGKDDLNPDSVFLRSAPSENAMYSQASHSYESAAKSKIEQSGSSSSSGAPLSVAGGYSWSQTQSEVEVIVALPKACGKRDFEVKVSKMQLKVFMKGKADTPLADFKLYGAVRPDEMTWTFSADNNAGAGLPAVTVSVEKQVDTLTWTRLEAASDGDLV